MGLVAYNWRQPNQKAVLNNKYDNEFEVATISSIRDSIASLYSAVNHTSHSCSSKKLNIAASKTNLTAFN